MVFTVYDKSYEEIPGITFSLSRENVKKLYAIQNIYGCNSKFLNRCRLKI